MAVRFSPRGQLLRQIIRLVCSIGIVAIAVAAHAEERPTIVVTPGGEQSYRLAVQEFADGSPRQHRRPL